MYNIIILLSCIHCLKYSVDGGIHLFAFTETTPAGCKRKCVEPGVETLALDTNSNRIGELIFWERGRGGGGSGSASCYVVTTFLVLLCKYFCVHIPINQFQFLKK